MNIILFNEVNSEASLLPNERNRPVINPSATIRNSQILGNVIINDNVHIVNAVLRADEGTPFYIGANSNIQDFAVLHGYTTQKDNEPIDSNLITVKDKGNFSIYIAETEFLK